jgi:hypothetical protein
VRAGVGRVRSAMPPRILCVGALYLDIILELVQRPSRTNSLTVDT